MFTYATVLCHPAPRATPVDKKKKIRIFQIEMQISNVLPLFLLCQYILVNLMVIPSDMI